LVSVDEIAGAEGGVVGNGDDRAGKFGVPAGDEAVEVCDGLSESHGNGE